MCSSPTHPGPLHKAVLILTQVCTHPHMCAHRHGLTLPDATYRESCSLRQERKLHLDKFVAGSDLDPTLPSSLPAEFFIPLYPHALSGCPSGWVVTSASVVIQVTWAQPGIQLAGVQRRLGHCSLSRLLQRGVSLLLGLNLLCCLPAGWPWTSSLTSLSFKLS